MDVKQVLSFIKIEHTLFSLPFVLMGYLIAVHQFGVESHVDLLWILLAAVGARGIAMALHRIIDRDIDAANPRTQGRHHGGHAMSTCVGSAPINQRASGRQQRLHGDARKSMLRCLSTRSAAAHAHSTQPADGLPCAEVLPMLPLADELVQPPLASLPAECWNRARWCAWHLRERL